MDPLQIPAARTQNPLRDPCGGLQNPSEKQISSESLWEVVTREVVRVPMCVGEHRNKPSIAPHALTPCICPRYVAPCLLLNTCNQKQGFEECTLTCSSGSVDKGIPFMYPWFLALQRCSSYPSQMRNTFHEG